MRRLRDVSIRTKLYALVALCTLVVLGLSGWLLAEFRINGPVYGRIIAAKDIVADVLPPPEYIVEPLLILHETDPNTIDGLAGRFRALEAEYRRGGIGVR